jgi:hypothetical protein
MHVPMKDHIGLQACGCFSVCYQQIAHLLALAVGRYTIGKLLRCSGLIIM